MTTPAVGALYGRAHELHRRILGPQRRANRQVTMTTTTMTMGQLQLLQQHHPLTDLLADWLTNFAAPARPLPSPPSPHTQGAGASEGPDGGGGDPPAARGDLQDDRRHHPVGAGTRRWVTTELAVACLPCYAFVCVCVRVYALPWTLPLALALIDRAPLMTHPSSYPLPTRAHTQAAK